MWSEIFSGVWVQFAAYVFLGVAVFLFVSVLTKEEESRAAAENLAEQGLVKKKKGLAYALRPFYRQYFVPIVRSKAFLDQKRIDYRKKVIASGLRDDFSSDDILAYKLFLIFFFPVVLMLMNGIGLLEVGLIFVILSGVLGWFYPDLWLKSLTQKRQDEVRKALPFVVDLLALSTEAGLDFMGSISRVVEKSKPSALIEELEQVLKEIRVGSSRSDALREMASRLDMSEINSFVAILVSSDSTGAPIGKVLRQQSDQIRTERFMRAEKIGGRATSKLLGVTFVFIVPAFFLMIIIPACIPMMSQFVGGK